MLGKSKRASACACLLNSSITKSLHFKCKSLHLAVCPMSPHLIIIFIKSNFYSSLYSKMTEFAYKELNFFTKSKCLAISVIIISSITSLLTVFHNELLRFVIILYFDFFKILKTIEQCIISRILMSLYYTASSSYLFIKKRLVTPG